MTRRPGAAGNHPPILGISGYKNTGKTTLAERLVGALTQRGHRVGAVKHDRHGFGWFAPGTDSFRLSEAGASAVALSGPGGHFALERFDRRGPTLWELAGLLGEVEIVLAEGFKEEPIPKLVLLSAGDLRPDGYAWPDYLGREDAAAGPLAFVVPRPPLKVAGSLLRVYHRDDIEALVALAEQFLVEAQNGR